MKEYRKPIIEEEKIELENIIADSNLEEDEKPLNFNFGDGEDFGGR